MSLTNFEVINCTAIYCDETFRDVLETFIPTLKASSNTTELAVEPYIANAYKSDFYSLLYHYSVSVDLHYVVMRMNGILSPMDYDTSVLSYLIPDANEVEKIRQVYITGLAKKSSSTTTS